MNIDIYLMFAQMISLFGQHWSSVSSSHPIQSWNPSQSQLSGMQFISLLVVTHIRAQGSVDVIFSVGAGTEVVIQYWALVQDIVKNDK